MLWGSGAIFLRLLGSHRENKSMKELVFFNDWCFFVPVSQLSTRDLFDFLENLKLSKTFFFVLNFSSSSISRTTSIMISLFQIIFRNSFQEVVVSWIFGIFTKSIVVSILDFFDTSLSERCLNCWLVKIKSWLLSLGRHVENRLKVDEHGWGFLFSLAIFEEKSPFKVGCHVVDVTWLSLLFQILFLFCLERKNLSPNFWSDCIFFWTW